MVVQFIGLILFSLGIIGLLTVKTFVNNEIFKNISDIILSIFPIYLLFFIPINLNTLLWTCGLTLAYNAIERKQIVGLILYLLVYTYFGVLELINNFNIKVLIISFLTCPILITSLFLVKVLKLKVFSTINAKLIVFTSLYILFALTSLVYMYGISHNFGFLMLFNSDVVLGFKCIEYIMYKNEKCDKILSYIVLLLFYVGVILASVHIPFI